MSIDTIHLMLDNWSVKAGASIVLTPGNINYETGEKNERLLFKDSSGHEVYGSKAVLNTQKINLTIKPFHGHECAFLSCSLPKQIRDNNYKPLEEKELKDSLESIESELELHGIEAKVNNASISRLDINKDILPSEHIESYAKLFSLLQANRANNKSTYGTNGWLFSNTVTEYCIYDKLREMANNKKDISGLPETLRFEHRCKGGAKVKEFYNFTTVSDLKKYGFNALEIKQSKTWKDNFFKYDIKELEYICESQLRNELLYYQSLYGNFFFSRYLKDIGASRLTNDAGGVEVIEKALESMDCSRLRIYRAKKELRESILRTEALKPEPINIKTLGFLYNELREKVCDYVER